MVGEFIVLRRKELGIKRKDLAEKLEVTYNYINLIETNKRKISKKLLPKIAKELQVSEEELDFYNTNKYGTEKKFIKRQIDSINNKLAKLETDKIILKKDRQFLCKKLNLLERQENKFGGVK